MAVSISRETVPDVGEAIALARDMRARDARGETLHLTEDELAFYDALETSDSAVAVLGDETLRDIARELVATVKANVTIDWTVRENVISQRLGYLVRCGDPDALDSIVPRRWLM